MSPTERSVNLAVKDAEQADKLAYSFVTATLTLAREAVPAAFAAYNHEKVLEITPSLNPPETVKKALEDADIPYNVAEVTKIPKNTVKVEGKKAQQMLNLMQALEDNDDVSHVYANFDISEEVMEALS